MDRVVGHERRSCQLSISSTRPSRCCLSWVAWRYRIENVTQTLKQVEEYKTQLDQYANQLQNTMAPAMNIWDDARQLERLQSAATGARGQMEAIGYANQLASQQANQLLQIRGLLIAQQNAVTTRMQAQMAEEARQQAATNRLRKNRMANSPATTWGPGDLY